jgi:hypothetical protein
MPHFTIQFSWHVVTAVGALQLVQLCFAGSFCGMNLASKSLKSVLISGRSRDTILVDTTNIMGSNWVCCGPKGVNPPAMRLRGGAAKQADPSAESVPAAPPAKPVKTTKGAKSASSKESQETQPAKPVKATKAASKDKAAPARTESPDAGPAKPAKTTAKPKAKSKSEDAYSVIHFSTRMRHSAYGFQLFLQLSETATSFNQITNPSLQRFVL